MVKPRRRLVYRTAETPTPLQEARLELSYLEPIHRVIVEQLRDARGEDDEENYQRIGVLYNSVMSRRLELFRIIAEIEDIPPCAGCGSMAQHWTKRKRNAREDPRLESQQCLECDTRVDL